MAHEMSHVRNYDIREYDCLARLVRLVYLQIRTSRIMFYSDDRDRTSTWLVYARADRGYAALATITSWQSVGSWKAHENEPRPLCL